MTLLHVIVLSLIAVATAVLSGVIGMAGGVTLLSIMTFFLPWNVLIPIHGIAQMVSNGSRALFLKSHLHKKIFLWFCVGVPFGALGAVYLVKSIDSKTLPLLLISVLILYVLFKPKKLPPLKLPIPLFAGVGLVAGFLGILVGATGPFQAVFFLRDDMSKEEIVSTKALCQLAVHFTKIPAFLALGFDYGEYWMLILGLSLASIVGSRIGVKLLGKISENFFIWLYKIALFAAVLRIYYKVLEGEGFI